jgi:Ca-activated chloride channel family protein
MAVVAIATLFVLMSEAVSAKGATLALVLAVDVSASVTADSYVLQRNGIAQAFADPRLAEVISAAPGGIEVLVLEWSDPDKIVVTVDWTHIADAAGAHSFAAAVRATSRSSAGLTAIGPALMAAAAAFDHLPEPAARRMIDISGDGMANFGLPPPTARDHIAASGIAINGLAIVTDEPGLADYYRSKVIVGPSAFVAVARTFDDFAGAMLRKLVREVASASMMPAPLHPAQMQ